MPIRGFSRYPAGWACYNEHDMNLAIKSIFSAIGTSIVLYVGLSLILSVDGVNRKIVALIITAIFLICFIWSRRRAVSRGGVCIAYNLVFGPAFLISFVSYAFFAGAHQDIARSLALGAVDFKVFIFNLLAINAVLLGIIYYETLWANMKMIVMRTSAPMDYMRQSISLHALLKWITMVFAIITVKVFMLG